VNLESGFESRFIKARIRLACICWLEFGSSDLPEIKYGTRINEFPHVGLPTVYKSHISKGQLQWSFGGAAKRLGEKRRL
jgi:hypothetical protein